LKVTEGCSATVFEEDDFKGQYLTTDKEIAELAKAEPNVDNHISSLKVIPAAGAVQRIGDWLSKKVNGPSKCCITIFEDRNYEGRSKEFCADTPSLGHKFDKISSSIKITEGCVAEVYDEDDYKGNKKTLAMDLKELEGDINMNEKISSLKIHVA